jgi:protein-tyrosine-phosphatase
MAEGIARSMAGRLPGVEGGIASAGIEGLVGTPPPAMALDVANAHGIDISSHRARQLDKGMLDEAKFVLCMTKEHKARISSAFPRASKKVFLLTEFGAEPPTEGSDIEDPYGGSRLDYERCFLRIRKELERIVRGR